MATNKRKDKGGNEDSYEPQGPGEDEENNAAIEIHEAYAAQYLGGGAPPTTEAFRRGAEQFNGLPGALKRSMGRAVRPLDPTKTDCDGQKGGNEPSGGPES